VPVKNAAPTGITHFLFPPGEPSLKPPALFLGVNLLITNGLLLFFPCLSPFFAPSARGAVAGAVDEDLRNVNGKILGSKAGTSTLTQTHPAAAGMDCAAVFDSFFTGTLGVNFGLNNGPFADSSPDVARLLPLLAWLAELPLPFPSPFASPVSHAGCTTGRSLLGADIGYVPL
jgi:hypothetical protein